MLTPCETLQKIAAAHSISQQASSALAIRRVIVVTRNNYELDLRMTKIQSTALIMVFSKKLVSWQFKSYIILDSA